MNYTISPFPLKFIQVEWKLDEENLFSTEQAIIDYLHEFKLKILSFNVTERKAFIQVESNDVAAEINRRCKCGQYAFQTTYLQEIPSPSQNSEKDYIPPFLSSETNLIERIEHAQNFLERLVASVQEQLLETNSVTLITGNPNHSDEVESNSEHIQEGDIPEYQCILEEFLEIVNTHLSKTFNACILLRSPYSPIFLQHSRWGDSFIIGSVKNEEWSLSLIRNNRVNSSTFTDQWVEITGEMRFTQPISPTSSSSMQTILFLLVETRSSPCSCVFSDHCDDQLKQSSIHSKPTLMEQKHVYEVYDQIASHFSQTRFSIWTSVQSFLDSIQPHSFVLDLGCGNGKYLHYFKDKKPMTMMGCDRSIELLKICKGNHHEVSLVDGLFLPYRKGVFDAVICIAVLHHLSTNSLRRRFLLSMMKVMRKGGRAMIVVWSLEQLTRESDKDDRNGKKSRRGTNRSKFSTVGEESLISWTLKGKGSGEPEMKYYRYYHLFPAGELEWLISTIDGLKVIEVGYDNDNWYAVIEKVVDWGVCLKRKKKRKC